MGYVVQADSLEINIIYYDHGGYTQRDYTYAVGDYTNGDNTHTHTHTHTQ